MEQCVELKPQKDHWYMAGVASDAGVSTALNATDRQSEVHYRLGARHVLESKRISKRLRVNKA